MELDAVRPGGGVAGEELRLGAALLPLRLRLDQSVVDFLQARPNLSDCGGRLLTEVAQVRSI